MIRYRFTIYKSTNDPDGEPYEYYKTVWNREAAQKLCPINGINYCNVCLEEKRIESDELGQYIRWEVLSSGTLENEELHSNESLEKFMYPQ